MTIAQLNTVLAKTLSRDLLLKLQEIIDAINNATDAIDEGGGADLPQDLDTTDTPIFAGVSLTGLTASNLVATNSSKALVSTDLSDWLIGSGLTTVTDSGVDGIMTINDEEMEFFSFFMARR